VRRRLQLRAMELHSTRLGRPGGWPERALAQCRATPWSVVVLHDLPTGAMLNLERFIGLLRGAGAEIVQEFPPECVPILRGRVMFPVDQYVAA
jgi:peptidoglycan-N-acetylglucosamine deacetylase